MTKPPLGARQTFSPLAQQLAQKAKPKPPMPHLGPATLVPPKNPFAKPIGSRNTSGAGRPPRLGP